jgi:hypothetical protein
VQALAGGVALVLVPGVVDELLHLLRVAQVDFVDLGEIAADDGAARQQQVGGAVVVGLVGDVAVGQHALRRQAAAVRPALVERGDGQQVGDVDLLDELNGAVDDALDQVQAFHVDRPHRAGVVDVDGAGHAAHQPVRVRVLAAEDGVDLDDLLLEIEGLQVVRHRHQVGLGRQLVGRVAPVAVHERAELAGFDELLQPVLDVAEVARRGQRPVGDLCASSEVFFGSAFRALTTSTQSSACR